MNVTFLGGCTYGVEDLNNAVAKLVGTGVAPFTAKDSYNYEDLNSLTSSVTAQGVSLGMPRLARGADAARQRVGAITSELKYKI